MRDEKIVDYMLEETYYTRRKHVDWMTMHVRRKHSTYKKLKIEVGEIVFIIKHRHENRFSV